MASDDEFQAVEEHLDSMKETLDLVKKSLIEQETCTSEEKMPDQIVIEANTRTVESLKRALAAMKKSLNEEDATTNDLENTLGAMKITSKSEEKSAIDEKHNIEVKEKKFNAEDGVQGIEYSLEYVEKSLKKKKDGEVGKSKKKLETAKAEDKTDISTSNKEKFKEIWEKMVNLAGDAEENYENKETAFNMPTSEQIGENFQNPKENPEGHRERNFDAYRSIGMDNPLNAMLFSEQLIEYVLKKLGHDWPCIEGARNLQKYSVSVRFSKVIGEAIIVIIDTNIEKITESYKQLMKKKVQDIGSFRKEASITASFFFSEGYRPDKLLIFAAQLAGLSAFYLASGNTQIADASAQVLSYIINYYIYQFLFSPISDWFVLHLEAQNLRREIETGKIQFVLPGSS